MGLSSIAQNMKVAAAAASTALAGVSFGGNPGVDDARRDGAASSMTSTVADRPAPAAGAAPDAAPKITAHEMVDVQVRGPDGNPVTVRVSSQPLATVQDADRELLSSLAGGPSIRSNLGIALDRKSAEGFANGRLSAWDVTTNSPRIIGSLTQRGPEISAVIDSLKAEGYTGAALAMTHGSERGVLLLGTKENGVMALAYEIPSLRRDAPGTDARDSLQFKALMPGVLRAMVQQSFGLEVAPGAAAPTIAVAPAPAGAPQAEPAQRRGREAAQPPAVASPEELSRAIAGRYAERYSDALAGKELANGNWPVASLRTTQRLKCEGYLADVRAVQRGTGNDLNDVEASIRAGVVTNEVRIVAVRMGRSPEEAANLQFTDLSTLETDVDRLRILAAARVGEYTRKISDLRR